MKHLLNTLYVTTQDSYLSKDGETIAVHQEGSCKGKFPAHLFEGLVLFGQVSCSPWLLAHCAEKNIAVSWLTEHGRFLASMHGPQRGNVLLRRGQYRQADDPVATALLARCFLIGKIVNCRTVLLRAAREHPAPLLDEACERLRLCLHRLSAGTAPVSPASPQGAPVAMASTASTPSQPPTAPSALLDVLRGIEGEAAHIYFGVFGLLITNPDPAFTFVGRNRRPPLDVVNCLLSFLYTLLAHDVRGALEAAGLDPAVGFLHRDRPGRPSLALDMMEEFRPYLADRLVCTLVNRGQVKAKGFKKLESGAVIMTDDTRKEVIRVWQERKQEEVEHPFLKERMNVGVLWHMQARLLARCIRGDLEAYPPFVIR